MAEVWYANYIKDYTLVRHLVPRPIMAQIHEEIQKRFSGFAMEDWGYVVLRGTDLRPKNLRETGEPIPIPVGHIHDDEDVYLCTPREDLFPDRTIPEWVKEQQSHLWALFQIGNGE